MEPSRPAGPPPDPMQQLLQVGSGYFLSSALWVATELDIAGLLSQGPKTGAELASATNTNADILTRVVRCLTVAGVFAETVPGKFILTPAAELLRRDVPGSQRDTVIWMADPFHHQLFAELMHTTKTGQPGIEHVTGKAAFEYFTTDPVENVRFNAEMTSLSANQVPGILEAYDFSPFKTLVDVGGGHGYLMSEVLQKYPGIRGIIFDLAHVLGATQEKIGERGLKDRCRTVDGNFFESVPEGGDAYLMKFIIHDWDDEQAGTILKNCRRALQGKPNGKLLLVELVRPAGNEPHFSKIMDLEMLMFPGGRERTEDEFRTLLAKSGFRLTRVVPTKGPMCIIEGTPA